LMDLELNDIQQELASTLHKYLRSEYDAAQREEILRSDEGISRQKWQAFAEMGLLGLSVPESYGGADMTFNEVAVVAEAFGRSLATAVRGTNALLPAGNEEQKQAILPGVCEGQTFLALAALEPSLRYAVDTPETTATATADGAVTLSGEKNNVLGGDVADHFIVTASQNGDLGLYLVAADAEGLTRVAHRQADGLGSANLKLENTPGQRLDAADAREVLTEVIDLGNAAIMAEAVGALEASLT